MKLTSRLFNGLGAAVLLAGLAVLPEQTCAGVYDTVAAWWHFDYDADNDTMADLDEIRDQRDWGSAATKGTGGKHATSLTGLLGSPQWTASATNGPAGGQNYGNRSMLFSPAVDGSGSVWPDTFQVNGLGLAGSATLVTRFRWAGPAAPGQANYWLYNNRLEWGAFRGWLFGIMTNASGAYLSFYTQKTTSNSDIAITTNAWYDIALVLTDFGTNQVGTAEFYAWREGASLIYRKYSNAGITNSISPTPYTVVGSENHVNSYGAGNNIKSFKGEVNHLAVWSRALSFAEVNEAFGSPQPLFQIGLNNGAPTDMRPESETDADYYPGDPWHTMRRAVTGAYRDATFHMPLTALQRRLPYVYHVDTSTDGQAAGLSLVVNGVTNAAQAAGNGTQLYWYVGTNLLVTGTNTFALHYEAGPSPFISFDWLELAGSWQVGYEDNSQTEFIIESSSPDDFFVSDPSWLHLERAITSGDTNVNIHFTLSPELVSKYRFRYTTRIISQGDSTNHFFSVDFNNAVLGNYSPVPDGAYLSYMLDKTLVKPGDNVIKVRYDSPYVGWLQFDFHRLEALPWPKGSIVMLR